MTAFTDDLCRLSPGISMQNAQRLETVYGKEPGFLSGLDIMARMIYKNAAPKNPPAFGMPWDGIYSDMISGKHGSFSDAYNDAIIKQGMPTFALHDAVQLRIAQLEKLTGPGGQKSSEDYESALDTLGYSIRLNLAGNKIEVNGRTKTDFDDADIHLQMRDLGYSEDKVIDNSVLRYAEKNKFHPIKEYLEGLTWDGVPRIRTLAGYFQVSHVDLWPVILRKWLIGAIDRVYSGSQNPMLVLDGAQGIGKSLFARWLCPLEAYFREGPIDPDSKDDKIAASAVWIWEVAELGSTTRRADRDALKNFLTTKVFNTRPPYGRNALDYPAMASYIGTINDEAGFLSDPTGARRFWVMTIDGINWAYMQDIDISNVWAEAYAAFLAGESHELTPAEVEVMTGITEEYQAINSVEEAIKECFYIDPSSANFTSFKQIRSVLKDPAQGDLLGGDLSDRKIADALKTLGLQKNVRRVSSMGIGGTSAKVLVKGYIGIWPKNGMVTP